MKRILFFVGLFILIAGTSFGQCPGGRCCNGGQCSRMRFFYPTFGGWWYYEQPIEAETVKPEELTPEEEKQLEEPATETEDETPVPTFRERALTRINAFRAAAGGGIFGRFASGDGRNDEH